MLTHIFALRAVRLAGLLTLGCCWLGAEPQSASLPTYWRYSHPDAKILVGLDLRGIMNSPLGQKLFHDVKSVTQKWTSAASQDDVALLQGIDRVFLSAPAQASLMQPSLHKEMVVALQGTFDLVKLRRMVAAKGQKKLYKGIELWSEPSAQAGKAAMVLALVSPQILLLGDPPSIKAAIDNHAAAGPEKAYDPVFLRATELAPLYEIWFVGNIPPKALAGGGEAAPSPFSGFDSVESFEAGISVKQGMQLQFNLNAQSPAEASKMAQGLAGMMMFATASQSNSPELGEFLKRVKFGSAGAQVQVSAAWSQPELETGLKQLQARAMKTVADPMASVPVRPAANGAAEWNVAPQSPGASTVANAEPSSPVETAQPAGPLTVKILNAEGGNKELVISPKP